MISVQLHRSLRPSARQSHLRALLTLPGMFRIVDGGGRIVVAERDADVRADRVIRVGPQGAASDPAEVADSPVWCDAVVDDFVCRLTPAREQIEGVRVLGFVTREDGNRWVDQRMDEALELLRRLLPGSPDPRWTWATTGDAATCTWEEGRLRVASVVCTTARAPMFDVMLAGRELSASLTVATGTTAQPSSFRLAQDGSAAVSAAAYSSARRELWLAIAREQGIEMTTTSEGSP